MPIGRKGGKPGLLLKGKKKGGLKPLGSVPSVQSQSGLKFAAGTLKVSIANTNAAAKARARYAALRLARRAYAPGVPNAALASS